MAKEVERDLLTSTPRANRCPSRESVDCASGPFQELPSIAINRVWDPPIEDSEVGHNNIAVLLLVASRVPSPERRPVQRW
jgi:hypothetical protein